MNSILIILKKELTDILRDKKTMTIALLVPLILYPIMFAAINFGVKDGDKDIKDNGVKVVVTGNINSKVIELMKANNTIKIVESSDPKEELKKGKISLIVDIPQDFDESIKNEKNSGMKVIYDDESSKSKIASSIVKETLRTYEQTVVKERMEKRGMDVSLITPFVIEEGTVDKQPEEAGGMVKWFLGFIPILIIISGITGSIPIAQDLGAGEKERGTFEPLLSTAVGRMSILWGKLCATTIMALLNVVCNVLGMIIAVKFVFKGTLSGLNATSMALILLFGVLISIATSALELALSIYARSIKEAGTYLSIVSIAAIILPYMAIGVDAKNVKALFFHIPITNVVVLLKEIIFGIYNMNHMIIVLGWLVLYIVGATFFTRYMFSKEEVIFRS